MDKILSARVDEAVLGKLSSLAQELHTSKKKIIERSILLFADQVSEHNDDVLNKAFGAWKRKEKTAVTVKKSRDAFNQSMTRHHK